LYSLPAGARALPALQFVQLEAARIVLYAPAWHARHEAEELAYVSGWYDPNPHIKQTDASDPKL
jgi:hypothetical protein